MNNDGQNLYISHFCGATRSQCENGLQQNNYDEMQSTYSKKRETNTFLMS